ncbi:MAG: hypothetical protein OWU33_11815 [Firmicutes bacterium]|jgi:hypothetical protein|nr:hypothetical protein [Bacillota bacterium]
MDIETIDRTYHQLQKESESVTDALKTLAEKLQKAASEGDMAAKEWLLDLKSLALTIQQEQMQMQSLMQAIHQTVQNQAPRYQATQGGGFFGNFLGSGFGRAIENGIGFGIGDDLINHLFRM